MKKKEKQTGLPIWNTNEVARIKKDLREEYGIKYEQKKRYKPKESYDDEADEAVEDDSKDTKTKEKDSKDTKTKEKDSKDTKNKEKFEPFYEGEGTSDNNDRVTNDE